MPGMPAFNMSETIPFLPARAFRICSNETLKPKYFFTEKIGEMIHTRENLTSASGFVRARDLQIQWIIGQLAESSTPLNNAELLEMMAAVAPQVDRVHG